MVPRMSMNPDANEYTFKLVCPILQTMKMMGRIK
jgi:hypothetical protein